MFLSRALLVICVCHGAISLRVMMKPPQPGTWQAIGRSTRDPCRKLSRLPDRHLVLVRYQPDHNVLADWVYNEADIDRSKVVWARDLGAAQNAELLDYFKDRTVWLLIADDKNPQLVSLQRHRRN